MRLVIAAAFWLTATIAPAVAEVPEPGETYLQALRWYLRAAEAGDPEAQFLLGVKLEEGIDVVQDLTAAAGWFGKAAVQGYRPAQFKLGLLLAQGVGVTRNPVAAVKWYRAAAEGGMAEAQYNLGVAYLNGRGVRRSEVEAYAWVQQAARQGLPQAMTLRDRLLVALTGDTLAQAQDRAKLLDSELQTN